jgi:hypothetical protein
MKLKTIAPALIVVALAASRAGADHERFLVGERMPGTGLADQR